MKKRTLVVLGLVLSMSIIVAGGAFARGGGGYGMMGAGYDRGAGDCYRSDVDSETRAQFREETQQFRKELRSMRLELRQEYDKESPDTERMVQLRKGMIDVDMNIEAVADKYDIDRGGKGSRSKGGYGRGNDDCRRGWN